MQKCLQILSPHFHITSRHGLDSVEINHFKMSGTLGIKLDYSQRKYSDDLDVFGIKSHLSDFQIEKLTYLFRCFNQTNTGYIEVCAEILDRNQCQWSLIFCFVVFIDQIG